MKLSSFTGKAASESEAGINLTNLEESAIGASSVSIAAKQTVFAPANFVARASASSQVYLQWSASPSATSYEVFRSTVNNGPYGTLIATVNAPTVNCYDNTVTNFTTYYYIVVAYIGTRYSPNSAQASATPPPNWPIFATANSSGYLTIPPAAPSWRSDPIGMDQTEASTAGAAGPIVVSPAFGTVGLAADADLVARNPVGTPVVFSRSYSNALGHAGISSPGLSSGWFHNFDMKIVSTNPGTWAPLVVLYPNGSQDIITPTVNGSTAYISCPAGSPYAASGSPSNTVGLWNSITLSPGGDAKQVFTLVANAYRLTQYSDSNSQPVTIAYDSSTGEIQSVTAGGVQILSFAYSGGLISTASAPQDSETVTYAFSGGNLSAASKINIASTKDWQYSYTAVGGKNLLNEVSTVAYLNMALSTTNATIYYDSTSARPLKVTDALSHSRVYAYNDAGGFASVYVLNYDSQLVNGTYQVTSPTNSWTENYDTQSRTTIATNEAGDKTTLSFDSNQPDEPNIVSPPLGGSYTATHDQTAGNTTQYTYPDQTSLNIAYDYSHSSFPLGLVTGIQEKGSSGGTKQATTFDYYVEPYSSPGSGFYGRIYHAYLPIAGSVGGTTTQMVTYTYTAMGDVLTIVYPISVNGAASTYTITYGYTNSLQPVEQVGEPVSIQTPSGTTQLVYDSRGRTTQITDPANNIFKYMYNDLDQLTQVTYPPTSGKNSTILKYTYAELGKPATVATLDNEAGTPFRQISLTPDSAWSPTEISGNIRTLSTPLDPQSQILSAADGNTATQYEFTYNYANRSVAENLGGSAAATTATGDQDGLLLTLQRPLNATPFTFNRDHTNGDRLSSLSYPASYGTLSVAYDQFGRPQTITDIVGTKSYTYDDLDNILTETITFTGQPSITKTFTYYPSGERQYLDIAIPNVGPTGPYVGTMTFGYVYDTSDRLSSVIAYQNSHQTPISQSDITYSYDSDDRLTYSSEGSTNGTSPTLFTRYGYDGLSRLISLSNFTTAYNGTSVSTYSSPGSGTMYDAAGNLLGFQDNVTNLYRDVVSGMYFSDLISESYGYDASDELTSDSEQFQASSTFYKNFASTYGYDSGGNINSYLGKSFTPVTASDQISGYHYDADGNTLNSGSSPNFSYDINDRIATATTGETYGYWADGTRAWKLSPGSSKQYFLYDGMDMVAELNSSVTPTAMFMYGSGGVALRLVPANNTFSVERGYFFDLAGNLAQRMTVSDGSQLSNTFFDAYGTIAEDNLLSTGGAFPSPDWVGYKGRYGYYTDNNGAANGGTGLLYCHARYYSPGIGRWLTPDPAGLEGDLNPYDYCGGNPVGSADPSGLQDQGFGGNPFSQALSQMLGIHNSSENHQAALNGAIGGGKLAFHQIKRAVETPEFQVGLFTFDLINLGDGLGEAGMAGQFGENPAVEGAIASISKSLNFDVYEVVAEYPAVGLTRAQHTRAANRAFYKELENTKGFSAMMDELFGKSGVKGLMERRGGRLVNPPGTEWHHPPTNKAVLQLMMRPEHRNPFLQHILHPLGEGGFKKFF